MLKKRIIFTFLYSDGIFVQSRNFSLQKVGDINWLKKNYNFKDISRYIDELIILNVSRKKKNFDKFIQDVKIISKFFFIPITVGGGIKSLKDAQNILSNGADKILINSEIFNNPKLLDKISKVYGEQSIIGGLDFKFTDNQYKIYTNNGKVEVSKNLRKNIKFVLDLPFGELFLNSINKDGTGMGLDFNILNLFDKKNSNKPIILSGGCGNVVHLKKGLIHPRIDAIATANLFNFIGDGLKKAREELLSENFLLPRWNEKVTSKMKMIFKNNY